MAEQKKSFVLYVDLIHTVKKLPNEEAGQLFKHILEYVNDLDPETDNPLVDIAFEPIKQQLKRDLRKWESNKEDRSLNGKMGNLKRWNPDLYKKVVDNQMTIDEAESIAKDRKVSPPDSGGSLPIANIAVNDNVNVNVNVNKESKDSYKEERKIDFTALLNYLNQKRMAKLPGSTGFTVVSSDVKQKYRNTLKQGYTKQQIRWAISNAYDNDFFKEDGKNYKHLTPEYFSRPKTLDQYGHKPENEIEEEMTDYQKLKIHEAKKRAEAREGYA